MQTMRVIKAGPLPVLEIVLDPKDFMPEAGAAYLPQVPANCWPCEEPEGFAPETAEEVDLVIGKLRDACRVVHSCAARARSCADAAEARAMERRSRESRAEAGYYEWKYGRHLCEFARRTLCRPAPDSSGAAGTDERTTDELATERPALPPLLCGGIGLRTRPARRVRGREVPPAEECYIRVAL